MKKSENILLIDTTGAELLVALVGAESVEIAVNAQQRRHSEALNQIVGTVLEKCGKKFADVSAFAVVNGSGSWTGTRVGVVAVKAFSFATGKPILELCADTRENLFKAARAKFDARDFVGAAEIEPRYDAEFAVTPPRLDKGE